MCTEVIIITLAVGVVSWRATKQVLRRSNIITPVAGVNQMLFKPVSYSKKTNPLTILKLLRILLSTTDGEIERRVILSGHSTTGHIVSQCKTSMINVSQQQ